MPWACPPPGHFEQSIECAEVFGSAAQAVDPQPEAQACVARAQSLLALGLADEAVRRAEQTVAVATLELSRSEAIWCHGVLAPAHWGQGNQAAGLASADEAWRLSGARRPRPSSP